MSDIENVSLRRRELIKATLAGSLVLGFNLSPGRAQTTQAGGKFNAFVSINSDGTATVQCPYIEMGQGTYTTIPALVAEEMDFPIDKVRVEQAPPEAPYRLIRGGSRFTGGSMSIRSAFIPMRKAGATARAMLLEAAAQRLNVSPAALSTKAGYVHHKSSSTTLSYAGLAAEAAQLAAPADVKLKSPGEFNLLGKSAPRSDVVEKSTGTAQFGVDTSQADMLFAAIRQAPVFGGKPEHVETDKMMAMPGVIAVHLLDDAVAVVARSWWFAENALTTLPPTFASGPKPDFDSQKHRDRLLRALESEGVAAEQHGDDPIAPLKRAGETVVADYVVPFLAHATLEPQNCTVRVDNQRCELWVPNQGVDRVMGVAQKITGLAESAITIHTPYLGGGFGRRFMPDFTIQALHIALEHKARPIKLIWSREEDTQHDYYRPMVAGRYQAALDEKGMPEAMHAVIAGDGPVNRHFPGAVAQSGFDRSVMEGAIHASYAIENRRIDYSYVETPPPIGFWRSVGNSYTGFFKESFVDEMAHAAGVDPVEYRRALLSDAPRVKRVLDTVADRARWRSKPWEENGARKAHGVALHESYDTIVAQIAEVSVDAGVPRVLKVWCAVDCGTALNPAIVEAQMQSGIAYGLSAALHEQVRMSQGKAIPGNFDNYPILRASEMPEVEVTIINSGEKIGGIGEPGTPPIAPAVCNALFTLTGQRIRELPIQLSS